MLGPPNSGENSPKPPTPEVFFPIDADQEHYLNVMTNFKKWRTPSPTPSTVENSTSSETSENPANPNTISDKSHSQNNTPAKMSSGLTPLECAKLDDNLSDSSSTLFEGERDQFLKHSEKSSPKLTDKFNKKLSRKLHVIGTERYPELLKPKCPEIVVSEDNLTIEQGATDGNPTNGSRTVISPSKIKMANDKEYRVVTFDTSRAASLTRTCRWGGCFRKIPDGGEVTVSELREMATRQQQQIENQQQLLVAREQRLKYLKQQEGRAAQVTMEAEKLRRLRERVEAQEAKLRRLRALRGQVDSSCLNAASLSSDLEAMRHLFSEKEKELVVAASKVEELTRQLEDLRQGRHTVTPGGTNQSGILQQHHQELDKLRRELLYRNSVNREASVRVASQKDLLNSRNEEIARIDKRIAELQQRLQRKRVLNQQLATQISAATQAKQAQLKAVQEKALREAQKENSADDIATEEHRTNEDLSEFERGKHDPKYQTLPHNTKFSTSGKGRQHNENSCDSTQTSDSGSTSSEYSHQQPQINAPNNFHLPNATSSYTNVQGATGTTLAPSGPSSSQNASAGLVTRTVHSIPTHPPSRGHALAPSHSVSSAVITSVPSSSAVTSTAYGIVKGMTGQRPLPQHAPLQQKSYLEDATKPSNNTTSVTQENRSHLPSTSLSLSFAQKMNLGGMATQSSAKSISSSSNILVSQHHQAIFNKDVENVRAMGHPAGSLLVQSSSSNGTNSSQEDESQEDLGGSRQKPILPPKPPVPNKPAPPPRQKGDPLAGSTENLHLIGSNQRGNVTSSRPQVFRYASQNVIMSTYTQQQLQQQSKQTQPNSETQPLPEKENENRIFTSANLNDVVGKKSSTSRSDGIDIPQDKVHVSINRRIEMPPDFMFPEDETPPSDLLGRLLEDAKARQEANELHQSNLSDISHRILDGTSEGLFANSEIHVASSSSSKISDVTDRAVPSNNEVERVRVFIGSEDSNAVKDVLNGNLRMEEVGEPDGTDTILMMEEEKTRTDSDSSSNNTANINNNNNNDLINANSNNSSSNVTNTGEVVRRFKKGNLKTSQSRVPRRVSFDPLALLLDASLEGELELVRRTAMEVPNPSAANDEGITALHNAICAGHLEIVTFLVTFGYDVNAQDADGWTPLHCAASCNNVAMVRFLVEHGACVLATTLLDHETAAEKCEQDEEGYDGCSQYLYSVQEKLGISNSGVVYAVYDYDSQNEDELSFKTADAITILRRGDEYEREWWWARIADKEGYVPRNLLGLYPRVKHMMKCVIDS